jgi:hypothetical protein
MAQEDIVKMARKAGIAKYGLGWTCWEGQLEAFAALVAAHEREACAKVCDEKVDAEYATGKVDHNEMAWTQACAIAIRARGEQ